MVKRPSLLAVLAVGAAVLLGAPPRGRAEDADEKAKKKKEKEEKEKPESTLESSEARAALEKVQKHLKEKQWAEAQPAARELLEKHGEKPIDLEKGHLVTASRALRRALAAVPAEGRAELEKAWAEELPKRLAAARGNGPAALEALADRFFPDDAAGDALVLAGDLACEEGSLIAAFADWSDVLELHPSAAAKAAAARRLAAIAPLFQDPVVLEDAARRIEESTEEGSSPLADALRAQVAAVGSSLDLEEIEVGVGASGALEKVRDLQGPGEKGYEDATRFTLPDFPEEQDPLRENKVDPNQGWQQTPAGMRWVLAGACVARDVLIVHAGKTLHAYNLDPECSDERGYGEDKWRYGRSEGGYLSGLAGRPGTQSWRRLLARYGVAVQRGTVFATVAVTDVKEPDDKEAKEGPPNPLQGASAYPLGKLVSFSLKKGPKDKASSFEVSPSEAKLSFVGTPLATADRVYCPAVTPNAPNEAWVVAVSRATHEIVWRRLLHTSDPVTAQVNQWPPLPPKILPAPSLSLAFGAVIVCSQNGVAAALDASDGRALWTTAYAHEEPPANVNRWPPPTAEYLAFAKRTPAPPLVVGGHAFLLPSDSAHWSWIRVADGHEVKRGSRRRHQGSEYTQLLGIAQGMLFLAGEDGVAAWALRPKGSPRLEWETPISGRSVGRPLLVRDAVLAPYVRFVGAAGKDEKEKERDAATGSKRWKGGIYSFDLKKGERHVAYKYQDPRREAGELVPAGQRLVSVGWRHAVAYAEAETEEKEEKK